MNDSTLIRELSEKIEARSHSLEEWHTNRLGGGIPPVYASVDLRNAGFKIAVVDTNLFPSGFNNLCETFSGNATRAFQEYFSRYYPSAKKILILPEEHTRNPYYQKNIEALSVLLENAEFEIRVGSVLKDFQNDPDLENFPPDLLFLNNDLSTGLPDSLKSLSLPILPSPELGWYRRRKSGHFTLYQQLIGEAAALLEIDPWFLSPITTFETDIDLSDESSRKRLQETADRVLSQVRYKYLQHGIRREPYVFIKNNSGTYGMGLTHIHSGSEILSFNRKTRNKLESAKGGRTVNEYLIQEGIPTADLYKGKPLEPVVYLVGGEPVGTFFRIHEEKNELASLNAPGMKFSCLCFHKVKEPNKSYQLTYENKDQLFAIGALLGKIASLAVVLELGQALSENRQRMVAG